MRVRYTPLPPNFVIEISNDDMTRLSDSIFCQNSALQGDEVRSLIITSPPEPERSHEKREAPGDQTRIIHRHGANGH